MPDNARSADPAVQAQLDRLWALSPGADVLGLGRITALLARLGNPERRLPPVFHVAGTNGKGSTCAFLRAGIEAAGLIAHVYSSPHLVRFNERIRLAGRLIEDGALGVLLAEVLDHADGIGASFFEVTTAAAFLAFSRSPADACIVEVGLGGRLDATNIVTPVVTGIAQLGIDHQSFLGNTIESIAAEKAGIAKRGVPLVTMAYSARVAEVIATSARSAGAPMLIEGCDWSVATQGGVIAYRDRLGGLTTPPPMLAGPHQPENLGLAIAMLRHQSALSISDTALRQAAVAARWPARMQRMAAGPLHALLPPGSALWLDGGHNPAAAAAVAEALRAVAKGPVHLVLGMLANKDPVGVLTPFKGVADVVHAVPVPDHEHHAPQMLTNVALNAGFYMGSVGTMPEALMQVKEPATVLILGSLYLAGEALRLNDELPD